MYCIRSVETDRSPKGKNANPKKQINKTQTNPQGMLKLRSRCSHILEMQVIQKRIRKVVASLVPIRLTVVQQPSQKINLGHNSQRLQ